MVHFGSFLRRDYLRSRICGSENVLKTGTFPAELIILTLRYLVVARHNSNLVRLSHLPLAFRPRSRRAVPRPWSSGLVYEERNHDIKQVTEDTEDKQ